VRRQRRRCGVAASHAQLVEAPTDVAKRIFGELTSCGLRPLPPLIGDETLATDGDAADDVRRSDAFFARALAAHVGPGEAVDLESSPDARSGGASAASSASAPQSLAPQHKHEHIEMPDGFSERGWRIASTAAVAGAAEERGVWCPGGSGRGNGDAGWGRVGVAWGLASSASAQRAEEGRAFNTAVRVYCALEDGSAFGPAFAWP
jgi:hypothetical protein